MIVAYARTLQLAPLTSFVSLIGNTLYTIR
nr:MAG TPA: hypothetical protein [Caudoviricetes sp.]